MAGAGTQEQRNVAAQALVDAGITGNTAADFMRIASRESEFNPRAHNPVPPDNSYGLWQINTLGTLWDEVRSYGIVSTREELFDPGKNAKVVRKMYDRYGFKPWIPPGQTSHLAGTLPIDQLTITGVGIPGGSVFDKVGEAASDVWGGVTSAADVLGQVGKLLANLLDPGWWKRLGLGAAGLALVVAGVIVWRQQALPVPRLRRPASKPASKADKEASDTDGEVAAGAVGKV